MKAINLDGAVMYVSSTDDRGVVDAKTRLHFTPSKILSRPKQAWGQVGLWG